MVQEIAHSLEYDTHTPPRMLIKVDIENVYDASEWEAILAILETMNFLEIWISWTKTCITSASFSFLVNGQLTDWIKNHRRIRQGDPISPYLFLLVSQNLSAILNRALKIKMVPSFDIRLNTNFNHLIFVDDLIIITRASRSTTRHCKLCLDIYKNLTSQLRNLAKASIHLPIWCNKRICSIIIAIRSINMGSFPVKYLGVLISLKRLSAYQC